MNKIRIIVLNKNKIILFAIILFLTIIVINVKKSKTNESLSFSQNKLSDKTIVIDAGHGGIDGGTSDKEGYLEKDINLSVALKVKEYLEDNGMNVIMTRDKDVSLEDKSNLEASRYLRDLDARKTIINSDDSIEVFVSLHVNYNSSEKPRGIEIYHYPTSGESKYIAQIVKEKIDKIVYCDYLNYEDLRCKIIPKDFYILRETNKPGILIELGYMSNDADNKLLKSEYFQKIVAESITKSLIEYLDE